MTDLTRFPALADPACQRDTRYGPAICGFCSTARSVAAGTRFIVNDRVLPVDEAIAYNVARCTGQPHVEERVVVDEIRRDGQRILRTGTNVYVQLKRKSGTRRSQGYVVECYEDDTVRVHFLEIAMTRVVAADEFVVARQGTTVGRV